MGNRDLYAQDFRWVDEKEIAGREYPDNVYLLERMEHGNFFGYLQGLTKADGSSAAVDAATLNMLLQEVQKGKKGLNTIRKEMSALNQTSERLRLKIQKLEYKGAEANSSGIAGLAEQRAG